jgi:c-di-GMP-binding flagellar brake protein YcgR
MQERRKHKRFPIIKDFAEPIELAIVHDHKVQKIPGVLTNLSAGGMDLVIFGQIEGKPKIRMSMRLPGFDRFEVEGQIIWTRPKGNTAIVGVQFDRMDPRHTKQINHMAEVYWANQKERNPVT